MATETKKHPHTSVNVTGADTLADKAHEALHVAEEKANEVADAVSEKAHEVMGEETPQGSSDANSTNGQPKDAHASDEKHASKKPDMECNLVIDESVVEKIAFLATNDLDGIVEMKGNVLSMIQEGFGGNDRRKGADADIDEGGAAISLSLVLKYGTSAIDLFDKVRDIVTKNIKEMTGLEVKALTINVVDVMDDDEIAERNGDSDAQQPAQKTYARKVA